MSNKQSSIGIFDSGFGGLTVMRAICNLLPFENVIYLGDTARIPYGNKSKDTIIRYSLENTRFLKNQGIKILVIACHTASLVALESLQQHLDLPVIGITEQGIAAICAHSITKNIGILGTRTTIASQFYQNEIKKQLPHAHITSIACPLFVPLIEEGYMNHPLIHLAIQEHLHPSKTQSIDTLLLACTHYPLIDSLIQQALGANTILIDPSPFCAQQIQQFLTKNQLINTDSTSPIYQFYVSDDPDKFRTYGHHFLNSPIHQVDLYHV